MIRVLAFIRRRPDVSRDFFRAHYEEIHVPTALPQLGGIVRYERHHIREEIHAAPGFDCMTTFDYRDAAAVRDAFARIEGPAGDAIRRDERLFMDKPANVFFAVEAGPVWQAGPAAAVQARLLVCVRRPAGAEPADFRARFESEQLPALRAAVEGASGGRAQWARAGVAQGVGFDVVTDLTAAGVGDLVAWARGLEAGRASVVAVRVSVHATPMSA